MKREVSLLIIDLDNTLYDWVDMWYHSFSAMINKLSKESGLSKEILESEFKSIFQKYGTSEYSFALQELPSVIKRHPGENIQVIYKDVIHAYNKARKRHLRLYPTVRKTLRKIKSNGCLIIGYTESMAFYATSRIKKLRLDGILDYIYVQEEHDIPTGVSLAKIRYYSPGYYRLNDTVIKYTPKNEKKPNSKILLNIIKEVNIPIEKVIYTGDNLMKDITMAQEAGVIDVYAKYGTAHDRKEYELLRKVTHWTSDDVEKEKKLHERDVLPTYILTRNFKEILKYFEFSVFIPSRIVDSNLKWEDVKVCVEVWKKIIDVQQHFNEIELNIRNLAVTILVAVFGATGIVLKDGYKFDFFGYATSVSIWILVAGVVGLLALYFMDRFWYHQFLYGAVEQAIYLEKRLKNILPEIALSSAIKRTSPFKVKFLKIRSTTKITLLYGLFLILLFTTGWIISTKHITALECENKQKTQETLEKGQKTVALPSTSSSQKSR